jgi:hypothetical protein
MLVMVVMERIKLSVSAAMRMVAALFTSKFDHFDWTIHIAMPLHYHAFDTIFLILQHTTFVTIIVDENLRDTPFFQFLRCLSQRYSITI